MDRYRNIRNIFPAILLAANLGAAEAPPHPGASGNYGGSKGGPQLCPFVWQGKIYVLGSTERIYCLDAKTGKEIWQSHTGWSATGKYKLLQDCIAANQGFPRNRSMEYSLTVADLGGGKAVVVCSDGRGKLHQKDGYPYTQGGRVDRPRRAYRQASLADRGGVDRQFDAGPVDAQGKDAHPRTDESRDLH